MVPRALTWVSLAGDGWIWYVVIAALPWWGGPVGGSAAARMIGVGAVNLVLYKIVKRWIGHCYKADPEYGKGLATRMGLPIFDRPSAVAAE